MMKTSCRLLLFILNIFWSRVCSSLVSVAITNLLEDYFVKSSPKVDVICYGKKFGTAQEIQQKLLQTKTESVAVQVSISEQESRWKNKLNISSILLFDSVQEFKKRNITWLSNSRMRHKHVVHIPNVTINDLEIIQDGFSIDNVAFLMNVTRSSIELVSSFMFTKNKCRSNHFVTINRFRKSTMKWTNSNFYPNKYKNFHACDLSVGTHTIKKSGVTIVFENHFNLNARLKVMRSPKEVQQCVGCDFTQEFVQFDGDVKYITSVALTFEKLTFTVPPGELHSPLEKMFLMFDEELWIAIFATLFIGVVIIQVINFASKKMQNFVFGMNIKTPTLNLVSIFLTGGQYRVPGRNFARFILMLFIVWCLIIRTCYQSTLFKLLQTDSRKPPIKTIDELDEKGFVLYGFEDTKAWPRKVKHIFITVELLMKFLFPGINLAANSPYVQFLNAWNSFSNQQTKGRC